MSYTPENTASYENLIKTLYINHTDTIFNNKEALRMKIRAYYEPVKSTSKKKRLQMLSGYIFPVKKPDADNIAKIICDALNGVAYRDDTQICSLEVVKQYDDKARVEIDISKIGE